MTEAPTPDRPTRRSIVRELVLFFAIAYAITWTVFGVYIAAPRFATAHFGRFGAGNLWLALGIAGPSLAGLGLTLARDGWRGVVQTVRLAMRPRSRMWVVWLLVALGIVPAVGLVALALASHVGAPPTTAPAAAALARLLAGAPFVLLPLILLAPTGGATGEDLFGWRAYAVPRFLALLTPLRTVLVFGSIWAVWHLPVYLVSASVGGGAARALATFVPFFFMTIGTVGLSVWLHVRSDGNFLFSGWLLHGMTNATVAGAGLSADGTMWWWVGTLYAVVIALVVIDRGAFGIGPTTRFLPEGLAADGSSGEASAAAGGRAGEGREPVPHAAFTRPRPS